MSRDNRGAASQSGVAADSSSLMMLVIFIVVALLRPVTPAGNRDHKEVIVMTCLLLKPMFVILTSKHQDYHLGLHLPVFVSQNEKGETIDHYQGSIDFNTVNTNRNTGMYFLVHPYG